MKPLESNWRELLDAALARVDGNKQAIAEELGVSRTMVSLVCKGTYHGRLDRFAQTVLDTYVVRIGCPYLGADISPATCKGNALRPAPTSSAREARHWRACQSCNLKPQEAKP